MSTVIWEIFIVNKILFTSPSRNLNTQILFHNKIILLSVISEHAREHVLYYMHLLSISVENLSYPIILV